MIDALLGLARFAAVLGVFWLILAFGPDAITDAWHNDPGVQLLMSAGAFYTAAAFAVVGNTRR